MINDDSAMMHLIEPGAKRMSIGTEHKERLVNQFLRGDSVTDLSAFYACQRGTVEDVLREAIVGLARLNQGLGQGHHEPENASSSVVEAVPDGFITGDTISAVRAAPEAIKETA